jgi:molybdate/tungstate transport system substrate-binding protein
MIDSQKSSSRRSFLTQSARALAGAAMASMARPLFATDAAVLEVAYAGSMTSIMEGPIKNAVAHSLNLEMRGRAQGASGLAQLIVSGSIRPDVFVSVTPSPMLTVLRNGKAASARPIARTEMVIAYSPKSRFVAKLDQAKNGKAEWWQVLAEPGFRFGRTDPVTDPQGRNIIFTMMLASKFYKQPALVEKLLGPTINERQIFTEPTVEARLQSGELDAASAYKIQPGPFHLPLLTLPPQINLGGEKVREQNPEISLTVNGKTYSPEPLFYYAAVLNDASDTKGAQAFVQWLAGTEAQALFRRFDYDAPGEAGALSA